MDVTEIAVHFFPGCSFERAAEKIRHFDGVRRVEAVFPDDPELGHIYTVTADGEHAARIVVKLSAEDSVESATVCAPKKAYSV